MASVVSVKSSQIIAQLQFSGAEVVKTRDVLNAYVINVGTGVDPDAEALLSFYNTIIAQNSGKTSPINAVTP